MVFPEKGFYYHYKYPPEERAYEVFGIGLHTEDETSLVLYRPLYKNDHLGSADCFARPLAMFMEEVEKDGKRFPRFTRIADPELITKLQQIRDEMYT